MKLLRWILLGCMTAGLADAPAGARAPAPPRKETAYKEKILGTWELTKSEDGPIGATIEFAKDGKARMALLGPDGERLTMEATYKVEGSTVTVIVKDPDGKERPEPATIIELTDSKLVVKDEKGKVDEFKKR